MGKATEGAGEETRIPRWGRPGTALLRQVRLWTGTRVVSRSIATRHESRGRCRVYGSTSSVATAPRS
jgi:hypothetical protein